MSKRATLSILVVSGAVMVGAMVWMVWDSSKEPAVEEISEADGIAREVKVQDHLRAERLASGWAELDLDGDQQVSEAEYGAGDDKWLARFRRRDKNADGVVSAHESRIQERNERKNPVLQIADLDKDGDGMVNLEEFPGPPDAFWRTDVDGDFLLSVQELDTNNQRYASQLARLKAGGVDAKGKGKRSEGKDDGRGDLTWQRDKGASSENEVPPAPEIERAVEQCFADSRVRNPEHQGRVKMKVVVANSRVSKVIVIKNQTGDELVSECLTAVVMGTAMPDTQARIPAWTFIMKAQPD